MFDQSFVDTSNPFLSSLPHKIFPAFATAILSFGLMLTWLCVPLPLHSPTPSAFNLPRCHLFYSSFDICTLCYYTSSISIRFDLSIPLLSSPLHQALHRLPLRFHHANWLWVNQVKLRYLYTTKITQILLSLDKYLCAQRNRK